MALKREMRFEQHLGRGNGGKESKESGFTVTILGVNRDLKADPRQHSRANQPEEAPSLLQRAH